MNKLTYRFFAGIVFILISLENSYCQEYEYFLSTNNKMDLTATPFCNQSNPASVKSTEGSITIFDVYNNVIGNSDVETKFSVRPLKFEVKAGSCRWIEGSNRGGTFSLGGYSIEIAENIDSYYEINNDYYGSALFFEKIDKDENYELSCSASNISAISSATNTDIIHWELVFESSTEVVNNSESKKTIQIDFDNFQIDLESNAGKTIFFRYKLVGDIYSIPKGYTIVNCSPQLIGDPLPTNTSCSYKTDGDFSMILDRDISPGQELVVGLYSTASDEFIDQADTQTLLNLGNGTFQYTWPSDQGIPGNTTYYVKFQTHPKADGPISDNDASWNSLVKSGDFTISSPSAVTFTATKTSDVNCHGGSDGKIAITANGGKGSGYQYQTNSSSSWIPFNSPKNISLGAGSYNILVKDGNNCITPTGSTPIGIGQPDDPITFSAQIDTEPTAYGFTNGSLTATASGGNSSFSYQWKNGWGSLVSSTSTASNIRAGTYTLTVKDNKYNTATDKAGCTLAKQFALNQPEQLLVTFTEVASISCNSSNSYGNPSQNGELKANATGGVPLHSSVNSGLDYYYTWKKKDGSGIWQVLSEQSETLSSIGAGEYAVNIKDDNGVELGTYTGNNLSTIVYKDEEYNLSEPDLLEVSLVKQDVYCFNGDDGSIISTITGGIGAYEVEWDFTPSTPNISSLTEDTYYLSITDENGCLVKDNITINQPSHAVDIVYTYAEPTFAGATNGWVKAVVTGGTALNDGSYTFLWQDESNSDLVGQVIPTIGIESFELLLEDIGTGTYRLTIADKNHASAINKANCTIVESSYFLDDPEPITLSIVMDEPISCNSSNIYNDPSSDGILRAVAGGGVKLQPADNGALDYYYTWKKKDSDGHWQVIVGEEDLSINGLNDGAYAVNIADANGIVFGTYVNNLLVAPTDVTYVFDEPTLLEQSMNKQDVYCHLGSDGWAETTISGGTAPYVTEWNTAESTLKIENLDQDTYTVEIRDSRNCQVSANVDILQPTDALNIDYSGFGRPSTIGESDGWVEAQITGGTSLLDHSYTINWLDEYGVSLNTQTATTVKGSSNEIYEVRLNDIPAGTVTLSIQDANYDAATTKDGCIIEDDRFDLYDPIEASFTIINPISCHQDNQFGNPSSDGILQVTVDGGLPNSSGLPYTYYWKKKNSNTGEYELLPEHSSETAIDLSNGTYGLNVEDALGIVMGVYQNNTLLSPNDALLTFDEPELLEISLSATAISCEAGNDGLAHASITGGTGSYSLQWSSGSTTTTAEDLISGTYLLYAEDEKECETTAQIFIAQPGDLAIDITQHKNPTCHLSKDGAITLEITGGETPYSYFWDNGNTTNSLSNLTAGTYTFQITDANGCKAFKEITLIDPEPVIFDLGEDRTLCIDQSHVLDISIEDPEAIYNWNSDNGFTSQSASVTLKEAGTYTATLTTGDGCIGTDTIIINNSNEEIDADFLITSQAFADESILLINTSEPLSDQVEWILQKGMQLIDQTKEQAHVSFDTSGTFIITLKAIEGECYQEMTKTIVVEEARPLPDVGDTENPFILSLELFPNPSTGSFEVEVLLAEEAEISLRIYNMITNMAIDDQQLSGQEQYNIQYNLQVTTGIYLLLLETPNGSEIRKIIVQ